MGKSFFKFKVWALAALVLTLPSTVRAGFQCSCSRIQSVSGSFGARDQLRQGSWLLSSSVNWQRYSDVYAGRNRLANSSGRSTDQLAVLASVEYSLSKRWTLSAQAPYVSVTNKIPALNQKNAINGLGDIRLSTRTSFGPAGGHGLVPQVLPQVTLGLPTGKFDPALGNANISTGLGVPTAGFGISAVWALVGGIGEAWMGVVVEQPIGKNSQGFKFGTSTIAQLGAFFGLYKGSGLSLETSFESYGPDKFAGQDLALRQGQFVYLTPGLQLTLNQGWSVNAGYSWLLDAWTGGNQMVAPGKAKISASLVL